MPNGFKGRHFPADFILLCVRWYLKYSISYRQRAGIYMHNYYFLSDKLSMQAMEQDRSTQKVSKTIAGQGNPNELEILSVQIQNLGTIKKADGTIAEGNAVIDIVKVFPAGTGAEAHREHWTVSVNFYVIPSRRRSGMRTIQCSRWSTRSV